MKMVPKDPPPNQLMENLPDLLLVDKPSGITSFDVIRLLRKKLGIWKMGHAGTLDPLASGLMIIGVGSGTKKLAGLIGLSKEYEAEILFGLRTDSGDVTGKTLEECSVPAEFLGDTAKGGDLFEKKVADALASMVGTLELPVPIYSAIKRQGKKLYELARAGATAEEIKPPIKSMQITAANIIGHAEIEKSNEPGTQKIWLRVHFAVSSGTYIRALAEELGRRLGMPATLRNLRRTKIGEYKIEDAIKPE